MNTITRYFRTLLTYYFKALPINKGFRQVVYDCQKTLKQMNMTIRTQRLPLSTTKKTGGRVGRHPALYSRFRPEKQIPLEKKGIHSEKALVKISLRKKRSLQTMVPRRWALCDL